jgi:mRNA interferase MazF
VEIKQADVVLCEFYFADLKQSKNRPVLVFKDNLPHDDFVAIPISSKVENMFDDEMIVEESDFANGNIPKTSKLMVRKTFVVSKQVVLKKYGSLTDSSYKKYHQSFCKYFGCES